MTPYTIFFICTSILFLVLFCFELMKREYLEGVNKRKDKIIEVNKDIIVRKEYEIKHCKADFNTLYAASKFLSDRNIYLEMENKSLEKINTFEYGSEAYKNEKLKQADEKFKKVLQTSK